MSEPTDRQLFREALGARLRAARLAGGMSYGDMEAATGISRGDVRKYEVGRTEPGAWKLCLMAKALNTTMDGLAGL
ncbi:helix-turn-helix domain-containing protein [Zavarzinella formosa]|uniref:helix-turn-helix domain-containing protein n=1 Tax=Zavarzinella formosa TaxID=360055 RepID=UPI00030137F0|nr:helix-turn-helix transcriptional regulator [Zavarzinella formosa]